jgi:hypothetical protein
VIRRKALNHRKSENLKGNPMRLAEGWRVTVRHARSIRLIVVPGGLSGVKAML